VQRPRPVDPGKGIHVLGDYGGAVGVSQAFRGLVAALRAKGWPLAYTEIRNVPDRRTGDVLRSEVDPEACDIAIVHVNGDETFEAVWQEHGSRLQRHARLVGCWYWELPRVPDAWIRRSRWVDELWAASGYVRDHLDSAVEVPVVRIPPALVVPDTGPDRGSFGLPPDRMVYLFMFEPSSCVGRKNPFAVIEAFRRAFADVADPPLLIIKTHFLERIGGSRELAADLERALEPVGGRFLDASWPRERVLQLIASCDVFVSLHRAEGFGLALAEAMALGKPVVATGYSAPEDFVLPSHSYPVDFGLVPIRDEDHRYGEWLHSVYEPGQLWAEPDLAHAARLLRETWENPGQAAARGRRAREFIGSRYSTAAVGDLVEERWAV
jgi:glycosyltransferase involved in cell wall biosynthesis